MSSSTRREPKPTPPCPGFGPAPWTRRPTVSKWQPWIGCFLVIGLLVSNLARADDEAPSTQPAVATTQPATEPQPFSLLTTDRLTGDWGGARTWLEDAGITFDISLNSAYHHNVHGGLQTHHGHRITGTAAYELTVDLDKLGLVKGGTIYALAESGWGHDIGEDRVGSIFGVNGTSYLGNEEIVLSELWYEQTFLGDKARFRLGKIDLTVDFDTNAYANDETAQFLNPALITTLNDSVPDRGLGAQLIVQPVDWFYAGIGAADAQASVTYAGFETAFHDEDYFYAVAEAGFTPVWATPWGQLPGNYRFGIWYDPQRKDRFYYADGWRRTAPTPKRDDTGFYFSMDQLLWKEHPQDESDEQGLGFFLRYGWANEKCNAIEHLWSLGAQYAGLFPNRDQDVLGFGFAQGIISDDLHVAEGGDRECVYELYYRIEVFPWLQITPDVQYLMNPGADHGHDAFAAGVRVLMRF